MVKMQQFGKVTRYNIARAFLGKALYWTTAYYVDGMMIDTGSAYCAPELLRELRDRPLKFIVNTHCHEDHIGANGPLQKTRGDLDIYAHPLAVPILADPKNKQPLQLYRLFMWRYPEPSRAKPIANGAVLETEHYRFKIIYTPGHSPDHLCLYEPEQQWLFSGDLFVGGKDRTLRRDCDIWQLIESLKKIAALPIKILFPGSARVRENPGDDLQSKITYLEDLGEKILHMYDQGMPVKAIARTLFKTPQFIEWFTLGHYSRENLIRSYLRLNENLTRAFRTEDAENPEI